MRIAVTYDNGEVFQHFGHSEQFKIYEAEDGKVISSRVIGTNGSGHSALASLLADEDIDVLICGGIGGGAQSALEANGIELCAGAEGSADAAVEAYLKGELTNTGANCDHHHEEGHSCHDGDEGCNCGDDCDCGDDCGGSCEGCEGCHSLPKLEGSNVGKTVRTHYRGTFNVGTQFDSSYDRGEPLEFVCGAGMMIPGYDAAVADMEVGQTIQVHLMPSEAYGETDPDAIFSLPVANLPGADALTAGQKILLRSPYGQALPVTVAAIDEHTVTFDANHEMAGKELNFQIELVEVLD